MKFKRAISGIVATILLLLFSIGAFMFLQNWFDSYRDDVKIKIDTKDFKDNIEIIKIEGSTLYLKNDYKNDLLIESIKIGSNVCEVSNIIVDKGVAQIDIGTCTLYLQSMSLSDIRIVTQEGILSEYEMIEKPLEGLLDISAQFSECNFAAGYIRLFGLSDLNNGHVDIDGTHAFNICIRHFNYTLGTASTGNFVNLLYVTETNNSAVWTDKGSIIVDPSKWYNISISSNGGTISFVINSSDMSSDGYECIARIDKDDEHGSHAGTCNSPLPDALWFKIDD